MPATAAAAACGVNVLIFFKQKSMPGDQIKRVTAGERASADDAYISSEGYLSKHVKGGEGSNNIRSEGYTHTLTLWIILWEDVDISAPAESKGGVCVGG